MFAWELFLAAGLLIIPSTNSQCSIGQTLTFSRWSGVSPERVAPVFVYAARGDEPSLAAACLARCKDLQDCDAVTLTHGKGHCYGVAASRNTLLNVDNDSTYFEKICLELPKQCDQRWWSLESTPGYRLHSEGMNMKVILNATAHECYAALVTLSNPSIRYRSAQWVVIGEDFDAEQMRKDSSITGNCVLNTENKFTEPESYRVANYHTLYIENECQHDYPEKIDRCSYEEYYNQTLKHVELTLNKKTKDDCKTACESEEHFVCRGFSWRQRDVTDGSLGDCSLHSEDLLTIGSWLMKKSPNTFYYRRVICLNISVQCSDTQLTVSYEPRGSFRGRLYVPGRGDQCGARANNGKVQLTLPLQGDCDVNFAHALSKGPNGLVNRTMAYVTVMIQNNAIIQTAGDRWVRVGCSPQKHAPAQQVQTAIAVTVNSKPTIINEASASYSNTGGASTVFNNSQWNPPPLTMYVVRADSDAGDIDNVVSLGEILELRIETTEAAEIEAYHLVASSRLGDSSVLLLDSQGCPTGQVDFPPFSRQWLDSTQRLSAKFKAFRFPTSHVVRFAIMVRFCDTKCIPRNCGRARSTRETNETQSAEIRIGSGVLAQSGLQPCTPAPHSRIPLELEFVVGSKDVLSADTLVRADHRSNIPEDILSAGMLSESGSLVCMHEIVVVSLALGWLAVQLMLLLGCCLLVKRYRNLAEMNMQKEYQSFDNVGFDTISTHRRVHWPDQNVDILHVN